MPIENNRDKAGIIRAFEFTYEQAWKPFSAALALGWILAEDEPLWIKMMLDRNLTSHTYREDIANEVIGHVQKYYLNLFEALLEHIEG